MGALPRPDLPPGQTRDLNDALHDLHHRAGWPSLRTLAREVGVSHTTVSHAFSSTRLPTWGIVEVLVEAMSGDVTAFHDLWLAASAPATNATGPAARIAGRRTELSVVRRHLEAGTGLLLVTGEAGMGKTKLTTVARQLVADGCFVATGSCLPLSTAVPMLPIADALQRVYDVDDGQWFKEALTDTAPHVAASIQRLVPDVELLVATTVQHDDDFSRQRLFAAVAATLNTLVSTRPLALLIEDLHWADTSTLDLIEHLATRGLAVPVLGTYRSGDPTTPAATAEWLGRVRRLPDTDVLALDPLSGEETTEQLALVLGRPPDAVMAATVHARSQGLPLFTEQLAGSADADEPLPELLADVLESRLVGLGERAWAIARVLGVADRALPGAVVSDAGRLTGEDLIQGLRELDGRLLLASSPAQDVVQLRHPLLAEAIRRRLVPGEAITEHRRLATALAATAEPSAGEIATHWQRAGELDEEVRWRVAAGRAAAERFAAHEEATHWLRVVELYSSGHAAPGGPSLSDVYFATIDALWNLGFREESNRIIAEARAVLAGEEGKVRADLHFRAAARNMGGMSASESLSLLDDAIATYRELAPAPELALALARRASVLGDLGTWDDAAADLDEAARVSVILGDVSTLRWMRSEQAWQEGMLGDREAGLRRIAEASALVTTHPDPAGDIRLGVVATDIMLKRGGTVDEILAAAAPGLAAAETWDASIFASALLRSNLSEALIKAGDIAAAAAIIDPAAAAPLLGRCWPIQVRKAMLDSVRGRLDAAALLATELVDEPRMSLMHRLETVPVLAGINLWRAEPGPALESMLQILDEAAETERSRFTGNSLVLAARAGADVVASAPAGEQRELATALEGRLRDLLDRMRIAPLGPGSVFADRVANERRWQAELARLTGTQTVEMWVRAATEWDRLTRPHDSAYCRWRGAQVALRDGQGVGAGRLLKRAAADARDHVPLSDAIATTAAAPGSR